MPVIDEISSGDEAPQLIGEPAQHSRGETKARKALSKLGLKKIEGINRVVLRRPKGVLFVISNPEVFKSESCYIVFGEAKIEDSSAQGAFGNGGQQQLAQQEQMERLAAEQRQQSAGRQAALSGADDEEADETGLSKEDIEVVVSQANCSRAKACNALREENGDLVQAILNATV